MKIKTTSIIHKFMTQSIVSRVADDSSIPTNLCPYTRKFIWWVLCTFWVGLILGYFVFAALIAPFLWLMEDLTDGLLITLMIGTVVDVFAFGILIGFILKRSGYGERIENSSTRMGAALRRSFFWNWIKMIHDKICPELEFE